MCHVTLVTLQVCKTGECVPEETVLVSKTVVHTVDGGLEINNVVPQSRHTNNRDKPIYLPHGNYSVLYFISERKAHKLKCYDSNMIEMMIDSF
jgi:hypothetical protein